MKCLVVLLPLTLRLRESRNSVFSTCNLVTETELQLLFIGMINSDRVNNVTRYKPRGASPLGQFLLVGPLFLCVEKVRGRK